MKAARSLAAVLRATALATALTAAVAASLGTPLAASAALVDRGGGLVYDSLHDLTWLVAPALLPGPTDWTSAMLFANDYVHGAASDWRLPRSSFIDAGCGLGEGFDCSDSEMAQLFYGPLGGHAGESVFDTSGDSATEIANVALFPALVESWFWSAQAADDGAGTAFAFHFGTGEQIIRDTDRAGFVLMLHAGDVGGDLTTPTPVPAPAPLPLLLAAAALALLVRPRRRPPH